MALPFSGGLHARVCAVQWDRPTKAPPKSVVADDGDGTWTADALRLPDDSEASLGRKQFLQRVFNRRSACTI